MKLKKNELEAILAEAEAELSEILQNEHRRLAKAQEGKELSSEIEPDSSSTSAGDEGSASSASASPEMSASGSSASAPGMEGSASGSASGSSGGFPSGGEGSASGGGGEPGMEGAPPPEGGEGGIDVAQLQAELEQEPIERLKPLYLAVKAAIMAKMGSDPDAAGGGEPPPPSGAPMGGPPPGGPPMGAGGPPPGMAMKMELNNRAGNGYALKSEAAVVVEELQKKVDAQSEAVDQLIKAFSMLVERPERKAITGVSFIPKGAVEGNSPVSTLSKTEVRQKLCQAATNPKLSKSDRDLITSYSVGSISVDKIAHLIKEVK